MNELSDHFLPYTGLTEHQNLGLGPRRCLNVAAKLYECRALTEQ